MKIGKRFNPHRKYDGSFIPEGISRYKGLSPGAKLVWGRFYRYCGSRGDIYPSMATLGDEIGLGISQTRAYVHELITEKFIEYEDHPGKVRTYYFLGHEALVDDDEQEPHESITVSEPLRDATGVDLSAVIPLRDTAGVPLRDTAGVPLRDATGDPSGMPETKRVIKESHGKEGQLKEPPLPPKGQPTEPVYEPNPTADPDPDCEVTLDTICGHTQERYELLAGRGTSAPSGKWAEALFAAYQDLGAKRFDDRIALFAGGRSRSLDEFARSFRRPSHPVPHHKASGAPQSNGRPGGTLQYPRQSPVPIRRECDPPAEALRWNQEVPGHSWEVWDEQLDKKWRDNTVAMNGRFEKWLSRCAEYSKAAKKQGKYGAGFSLAKALDNWPDVFNGRFEWMTAPEKADAEPERRYREL